MHPVSYTAQWMAAARALESQRADALYNDPYAKQLAEPKGFELIDHYDGSGILPFISIRTRYLDDAIKDLLADGTVKQVVLIAAGMDTRAFRLDWPDDVTVYEVDHGPLIEEKQRRLDALGAEPAVERRPVKADLTSTWLPDLEAAGFDRTQPTLWIAEALTFFLTDEQAAGLLQLLASASAPGSRLSFDILGKTLLRNPFNRRFLQKLADDGTPWIFGSDRPEEFVGANGWTVTDVKEPGQAGAGEGRWPYEVQPRDRKGASRLWLLRAELDDR
ncbi:SAM-dependent methyltransferase [Streptomyces triticagri]|uniref:S-adenosyl-L-methionine-dependent methyltransferase n=1 Tax=Streptomyces triticagri TaxID=2293568 RepID=A0A372M779_9ACTN|nr:SAM-dependent methyltransferase [Streptomyces triticagri]